MNFNRIKAWIINQVGPHKNRVPNAIIFVLGALVIHQFFNFYQKQSGFGSEMEDVLIAKTNIPLGQKLKASDVQKSRIPKAGLPLGTLLGADLHKILNFPVNKNISKGELMMWSFFDVSFQYSSFSNRIEKGYRAVTIPVDDITSVANMIKAGDHVDLLSTMEIPGESKPTTMTLLQNVTVFSVGNETEQQHSYSTITLMVLPAEANVIAHSVKLGNLTLLLRNPSDTQTLNSLALISDQELVQTAFRNHLQKVRDLAKPSPASIP